MKWRPISEAGPPDFEYTYLGRDAYGNITFIQYYPGAKGWKSSVFDRATWLWFFDVDTIELPEGDK